MDLSSLNVIQKPSKFVQYDVSSVHFSVVNRLSVKGVKENKQKTRSIGGHPFGHSIIENYYTRWQEYKRLSKVEKESYFTEKVRYKETIPGHFGTSQNSHPNVFKINSLIVETVIGDMFFHPDDHDGVTRTQALKSFTPCSDPNVHDTGSARKGTGPVPKTLSVNNSGRLQRRRDSIPADDNRTESLLGTR